MYILFSKSWILSPWMIIDHCCAAAASRVTNNLIHSSLCISCRTTYHYKEGAYSLSIMHIYSFHQWISPPYTHPCFRVTMRLCLAYLVFFFTIQCTTSNVQWRQLNPAVEMMMIMMTIVTNRTYNSGVTTCTLDCCNWTNSFFCLLFCMILHNDDWMTCKVTAYICTASTQTWCQSHVLLMHYCIHDVFYIISPNAYQTTLVLDQPKYICAL